MTRKKAESDRNLASKRSIISSEIVKISLEKETYEKQTPILGAVLRLGLDGL